MSDQPDNLMLVYLRRIDTKLDRLVDDMRETKQRLTTVELQAGTAMATEQTHYGHVMQRLDRIEVRLDLIERRLDIVPVGSD